MDRRKFIEKSLQAGIITGMAAFAPGRLLASTSNSKDVIVLKGGQPDILFEKGIEIFGGLKHFIKKGDYVVIKPDISHATKPEEGKTTHPLLIEKIIDLCYEADAGQVQVFDHTIDRWTKCYKTSEIERIAKDAYARVLPANEEKYYTELFSNKPSLLRSVKVHQAFVDADLIINVPILKMDKKTNISGCIKNLKGAVWNWDFYDQIGLDQCLAEFLYYFEPQLNVVDAYYTTIDGSPLQTQIIATDIVAADSESAHILEINPANIEHVLIANKLGFGEIDNQKFSTRQIVI